VTPVFAVVTAPLGYKNRCLLLSYKAAHKINGSQGEITTIWWGNRDRRRIRVIARWINGEL